MSNKCDPKLNIQIPETLLLGLNVLSEIAQNRPLTTQDVLNVFSEEELQQLAQQPQSRTRSQEQDQAQTTFSAPGGGQSRGTGAGSQLPSTGGEATGGQPKRKACRPSAKDKIGAWNTPVTTYGSVLGIPIEPRDANCPCGESE